MIRAKFYVKPAGITINISGDGNELKELNIKNRETMIVFTDPKIDGIIMERVKTTKI